jgi:hypothetical protein
MATPIGIKSFTIFFSFINVLSSLCVFLCFKLFHPSYVSRCLYTSNSFFQIALYVSSFSFLLALSTFSFAYYYFGSCLRKQWNKNLLYLLPCWYYFHYCVVATFVIVLFLFSPLCYYFYCVTSASNMLYVISNMLHVTSNMLLLVPMCCCYFYHTIGVSNILLLLSLCYWCFCHVVAFAIYMYLPLPMLFFCPFVSIMLLSALA